MHKRLLNEATIGLTIVPTGPILVKAGEAGADPTRPDMEFVRTWRGDDQVVYLPGSSLKGMLRAHCERIARTLDSPDGQDRRGKLLSCNPLGERDRPQSGMAYACSHYFERNDVKREIAGPDEGAEKYRRSCLVCQLFGNTAVASHLRITDAYPTAELRTEERNGVAIDRVFGSVAVGPFNYEVVTQGEFPTTIHLRNFTIAHLALLALALRDLKAGRVGLGFAKSRGLGQVTARFAKLAVRYPLAEVYNGQVSLLGHSNPAKPANALLGVGAFLDEDERAAYGYSAVDEAELPGGLALRPGAWDEAELTLDDPDQIEDVWRGCVRSSAWREVVTT